jgi:DNA-binding transcriptional ArsR family regulator
LIDSSNAQESHAEFTRLLLFLLGGTRGGENRGKILIELKRRPRNLNQLSKSVGIDYRSIQHHIIVLQKNNLVQSSGRRYGVVYSIHPWLDYHFDLFAQVCGQLGIHSNPINQAESLNERCTQPETGIIQQVTPQI